jgi:hypothetical protein
MPRIKRITQTIEEEEEKKCHRAPLSFFFFFLNKKGESSADTAPCFPFPPTFLLVVQKVGNFDSN